MFIAIIREKGKLKTKEESLKREVRA